MKEADDTRMHDLLDTMVGRLADKERDQLAMLLGKYADTFGEFATLHVIQQKLVTA